jgi:hypothetical protein
MSYDRRPTDGPVWTRALTAGRDFITPSDVDAALDAGVDVLAVVADVLVAIDIGAIEDRSLCAFTLLDRTNRLRLIPEVLALHRPYADKEPR